MASTFNPTFAVPPRQPAFNASSSVAVSTAPAGTFVAGTKVQVGGHRVVIEKYLSEGGFAHVYLVRLPKPINGDDGAVLKRVAVPDKEALASMRTEVETMKKLRGQRHIVTYIDSHASQLKGGGYEVFLLMEYCNGGGLIDFMNTRLQNRLTEPEILKIFSDTALGVACMHYLKPPLLHRDLKVENILISSSGSTRRYKLCDFGSTAPPRPAATSAAEGRLIEDDVQKHTTLQYRSPEMIDVYRKQPIDEKSDIWALGVLLYKLCYYKTPFEDQGQMAILNASFKFPAYPAFSDRIKKLIADMLRENPQTRPNIYQVVREVSLMRGSDIPIRDIYAGRTQSEARQNQRLPPSEPNMKSPPAAGAYKAPVVEERLSIPDIAPMRRGRPAKNEANKRTTQPSPSPLRIVSGDPFSALDSGPFPETSQSVEEVSSKFPSLDDFSLLHEKGTPFAFDPQSETAPKPAKDISQRVTDALADDAFVRPPRTSKTTVEPAPRTSKFEPESKLGPLKDLKSGSSDKPVGKENPEAVKMVSTGTMTSPILSPPSSKTQTIEHRQIFRVPPPGHRSSSQPRASDASIEAAAMLRPDPLNKRRPGLLEQRSKSQIGTVRESRSLLSSGPAIEVHDPSLTDLSRSKSANAKLRPSSVQLEPKRLSLRSQAHSREHLDAREGSQALLSSGHLSTAVTGGSETGQEAAKISSNVEFLKAMEEEEPSKRKEKRLSSGSKHIKRSSMPSISLSGTKNLLAGRFGEAFRRFETNASDPGPPSPALSPDHDGYNLTPIAGSEATDGRSDDGHVLEEAEAVPPEMRRELERRRLSQEEKRVAEAGAAYRQRLAEGGDNRRERADVPINPRAASIQSKVKTLLDESGRGSPSPTKKPEGYGRFTDPNSSDRRPPSPSPLTARPLQRRPPPSSSDFSVPPRTHSLASTSPSPTSRSQHSINPTVSSRVVNTSNPLSGPSPRSSAPPTTAPSQPPSRPSAPPKPQGLRTGNNPPLGNPPATAKPASMTSKPLMHTPHPPSSQPQNTPTIPSHSISKPATEPAPRQQLRPQQHRSSNPYRTSPSSSSDINSSSFDGPADSGALNGNNDDWEASFSKRYPSLAGLEMVEREIEGTREVLGRRQQEVGGLRVKDV